MTNKGARQELELVYGKGCMFKKGHIASKIEKMGGIKTYRVFVKQQHYTGKKLRALERNLTLHHLKHRSEGGETSAENGAVVNELAHRYLHSLPRNQEEIVNNMLREYKLNIVELNSSTKTPNHLTIEFGGELEEDDYISIPLYDNTPEQDMWLQKQKFNRAKTKQETRQQIEAALYSREDDYDR